MGEERRSTLYCYFQIECSSYILESGAYFPSGFGTVVFREGNMLDCSLEGILGEIKERKMKRLGILKTEKKGFYEGNFDFFKLNGLGTYHNSKEKGWGRREEGGGRREGEEEYVHMFKLYY